MWQGHTLERGHRIIQGEGRGCGTGASCHCQSGRGGRCVGVQGGGGASVDRPHGRLCSDEAV